MMAELMVALTRKNTRFSSSRSMSMLVWDGRLYAI